ncbi:hypothetical protein [Pseudarthrobacter sp. BIM B-2242]|uniref:hypothetical protein n=1 Tax=Pseudarthrobacter sp. BIM B-2242 TaxID=2772401 RepID=UPI00168AC802|nr:hypothetical protein [Pseudarthrobacter sp. BIM B-2242]QOD05981.1 hypothetical protein IDT60_20650 [Pseudarthrobacter sp. BIM B-2242]
MEKQQEQPVFKPFDVVLYDHEPETGLYFLPGTLATKPSGNWSHICIGKPVLRTLTDEELAAMYWHARHERLAGKGCHRDAEGNFVSEALVLERFATLPAVK